MRGLPHTIPFLAAILMLGPSASLAQHQFVQISVGARSTCAVTGTAELSCWGAYDPAGGHLDPTLVHGVKDVASVSVGEFSTCFLTTAGAAHCWGGNDGGMLGTGDTRYSPTPVPVVGDHTFSSIDVGAFDTCGVTTDQELYCWGGTLGVDDPEIRTAPTLIAGGRGFMKSNADFLHRCGLAIDGEVFCWGSNGEDPRGWAMDGEGPGRLGDGTATDRADPTSVAGNLTFTDVSAGIWHSCGVTSDGAVYCWGAVEWDDDINESTEIRLEPTLVESPVEFVSVGVGGAYHTCALAVDSVVYCWGVNGNWGLLGDGTAETRTQPTPVAGGLSFRSVDVGGFNACGVTTDGAAYCWGRNPMGELGDGTKTTRLVPTRVGGAGLEPIGAPGGSPLAGITSPTGRWIFRTMAAKEPYITYNTLGIYLASDPEGSSEWSLAVPSPSLLPARAEWIDDDHVRLEVRDWNDDPFEAQLVRAPSGSWFLRFADGFTMESGEYGLAITRFSREGAETREWLSGGRSEEDVIWYAGRIGDVDVVRSILPDAATYTELVGPSGQGVRMTGTPVPSPHGRWVAAGDFNPVLEYSTVQIADQSGDAPSLSFEFDAMAHGLEVRDLEWVADGVLRVTVGRNFRARCETPDGLLGVDFDPVLTVQRAPDGDSWTVFLDKDRHVSVSGPGSHVVKVTGGPTSTPVTGRYLGSTQRYGKVRHFFDPEPGSPLDKGGLADVKSVTMVDGEDGRVTHLSGWPVTSPSGRRVVTGDLPCPGNDRPTAGSHQIEIFEVRDDDWQRVFSVDATPWGWIFAAPTWSGENYVHIPGWIDSAIVREGDRWRIAHTGLFTLPRPGTEQPPGMVDGRDRSFRRNSGETIPWEYGAPTTEYIGFSRLLNAHLVRSGVGLSEMFVMIPEASNDPIDIYGVPLASPSGRAIVFTTALEPGMLYVYEKSDGEFVSVVPGVFANAELDDVSWESDTVLLVGGADGFRVVKRADGTWVESR